MLTFKNDYSCKLLQNGRTDHGKISGSFFKKLLQRHYFCVSSIQKVLFLTEFSQIVLNNSLVARKLPEIDTQLLQHFKNKQCCSYRQIVSHAIKLPFQSFIHVFPPTNI